MFSGKIRMWSCLFLAPFLMLSIPCQADPDPFGRDEKAAEYYSADKSVLLCQAEDVFYFRRVEDENGVHHAYIVMLKVAKTIKGKDYTGTRLACLISHSEESLELKGAYYLGFDGVSRKVFVIEPGNLCPVDEIQNRER